MPKTLTGKRSVWFAAGFIILFIFIQVFSAIVQSRGGFDGEFLSPYQMIMPVLIIPMALSGIAAFISGMIAIIREKERSAFVIVAVLIGLAVIFFLSGELLFPH